VASTGSCPGEREIFRLYAELGEDIVHGSAAVLGKPRVPVLKAAAVVPGHGFVVGRSRSQGAGNGIDHHFERMAHGGELAGIELVQQPMGMLSIHDSFHYRVPKAPGAPFSPRFT
jgi:hypothetical protein